MISKHFVSSDVRLRISETNALSLQKPSKRFAWDPTAEPRKGLQDPWLPGTCFQRQGTWQLETGVSGIILKG